MNKPEKQIVEYYDWDDAWEYLCNKYNFKEKFNIDEDGASVWNHIVEIYQIYNGKIFTLSNWELVYNNGKFAYSIPEWFKPILTIIIDEFGEIDKECTTPNTKTVNFRSCW
jgi:hypothetical protein